MNRKNQGDGAMWGWEDYRDTRPYEYQEESPHHQWEQQRELHYNFNFNNNPQWEYPSTPYQSNEWRYQEEPTYQQWDYQSTPNQREQWEYQEKSSSFEDGSSMQDIERMLQERSDQDSGCEIMCMMAGLSRQLAGLKSRADQMAAHLEYLDEEVAQIVSSREINESEEDSSDSEAKIETPQVEEIKSSLIVQPEEDDESEFCYAGEYLSTVLGEADAEEIEHDNWESKLKELSTHSTEELM